VAEVVSKAIVRLIVKIREVMATVPGDSAMDLRKGRPSIHFQERPHQKFQMSYQKQALIITFQRSKPPRITCINY
jgi:hypothetical protein